MVVVVAEEVRTQDQVVLNHYVMKVTFLNKCLIATEGEVGYETANPVNSHVSLN